MGAFGCHGRHFGFRIVVGTDSTTWCADKPKIVWIIEHNFMKLNILCWLDGWIPPIQSTFYYILKWLYGLSRITFCPQGARLKTVFILAPWGQSSVLPPRGSLQSCPIGAVFSRLDHPCMNRCPCHFVLNNSFKIIFKKILKKLLQKIFCSFLFILKNGLKKRNSKWTILLQLYLLTTHHITSLQLSKEYTCTGVQEDVRKVGTVWGSQYVPLSARLGPVVKLRNRDYSTKCANLRCWAE